MERIFDENERIRRAEELYLRRTGNDVSVKRNVKNKEYKAFKGKILFHGLLMINIALIVFVVQNKTYILSEEFMNKVEEESKVFVEKIEEIFNLKTKEIVLDDTENVSVEYKQEIVQNDVLIDKINLNESQVSSSSLMDEDVKNLKLIYKFINPISGTISSEFGSRESKFQNVEGYHTGIDIAAEKGTPIVSSFEGIVEEVSNKGDYGKHLKIRCNNVTTLYAHCSEIFVKKGQIVAMGQKIAAVGSTGNSTGPHLHFEIRIDDRFVDPGKVINF